jgi:DNA-binding FrmR family transcriptional regulator
MTSNKQKSLVGLKKARSHIDKIIRLIEEEKDCLEVLQQTRAVIGLLKGVQQTTMKCHLEDCFGLEGDLKNQKKLQEMVDSVSEVVSLVNR